MAIKFKKEEKLTFSQIVLQHLKTILELSNHQLRDSTITTIHSNFIQTTEHEDTRISFVQSVETLSYILVPYFDEKIKKVYGNYIEIINGFNFEIMKKLKKEYDEISEERKEMKEEDGEESLEKKFIILMKIKYAKKLFIELNLLLKRNDYLKSEIYGDTTEEVEDEEGGG